MGHDTFAWRDQRHADADHRSDPEIAYLRRSMGCADNDLIYRALGDKALPHYAGVSGDGTQVTFTKAELKTALTKAHTLGADDDQLEFLRTCLAHDGDTVVVGFY
jgi:hypothetical protein